MTYASPAIGLGAAKADRNPGALTAGGVALALGSIGVTVTSVLYALSPPAAALPAYPLDLAFAGARSGASILHAAGTVGIFSDIVMAVGVLLIAFELVQRERAVAAGGWIAMFLSIVVFTFVDAMGGYVLAPLAGLNDGASVFAGFKRLFDVLFLLGTVAFGGGAVVARATPPPTTVVDGTGAGDCFTAALTVALLDGRSDEDALRYACAAGALAVSRPGAQPALPWAAELER